MTDTQTRITALDVTKAQRATTQMLLALSRTGKHVYEGTVPGAVKARRRANAGEVTKIWRSGVWADGFGVERCLCCGLVTYPKQTKAVDECRCIPLAAAS